MQRTIIVVGGGPAGLSFARSLAGSPHRVVLIEPQPRQVLASPAPDGREIALTQRSRAILAKMEVWQHLPANEIHLLREARVLNGSSPFAMQIGPEQGDALGYLVSNHLIRSALFAAVEAQPNIDLLCGRRVVEPVAGETGVSVRLDDGSELAGDLLVAADSRFSQIRHALGIDAAVTRFGHTMLVCRIRHTVPHRHTSTEWFDHGRTVALLPLSEGCSGLVVTLPDDEANAICALEDKALQHRLAGMLDGRWGEIELITRPHAYPLAMTFAERFSGPRCALVGDTAVGMHPVTAHGFNFGLLGAWRLGQLVGPAADPGATHWLTRYAHQHRLATLPLYEATRQLVKLYSDDRLIARPIRAGVLRLGALPPIRRIMGRLLSEARSA